MSHTRTELGGLTAKALRPIAADLGITGASRLRKDDLISAILLAAVNANLAADMSTESFAADVAADHAEALMINNAVSTHDEFAAQDDAKISGQTVLPTAESIVSKLVAGLHALADESERSNVPSELCTHGIDATRTCSICKATVRELGRLAADVEEAHAEALKLDSVWEFNARAKAFADEITATQAIADVPRQQTPKTDNTAVRAALTPPPAEYFARPTRRGVETVVVERENDGRVAYRIIDPRTGHRSPCSYSLKAHRFASRYDRVPS
jgi:hypothetical protein